MSESVKKSVGISVPVTELTFKGYELAFKQLKDSYNHAREHYFPFYHESPAVFKLDISENIAGAPYYCWNLEVPEEYFVKDPDGDITE